jgi:hypothetical protein
LIALDLPQDKHAEFLFEQYKAGHATALKWFEVHAAQRMMMFRFFVTLFGVSVAGAASALAADNRFLASVLGVFVVCSSICFKMLDMRTSQLVKNSEKAIQAFAESFSVHFGVDTDVVKSGEIKNGTPSYRQVFNIVFWFCGLVGIVLFVLPWLNR